MNDLPYRENVCIILLNKENKFFLAERADFPGTWQFPQGGVEKGFSEEENAYKELEEETSVKKENVKFLKILKFVNEYEFHEVPKHFVGKFKGQRQRYYVFEFLGEDLDIDVQSVEHPEFIAWKWVGSDELLSVADPVRIHAYEKVINELKGLEY